MTKKILSFMMIPFAVAITAATMVPVGFMTTNSGYSPHALLGVIVATSFIQNETASEFLCEYCEDTGFVGDGTIKIPCNNPDGCPFLEQQQAAQSQELISKIETLEEDNAALRKLLEQYRDEYPRAVQENLQYERILQAQRFGIPRRK